MKRTRTSSRKQQHVAVTLTKDVSFRSKSTGFERWEFEHNALPELNFSDVDTSTTFLGKPVSFPLIISSMTGGYGDARRINRGLAEVCAERGLAMGVGSQRQAIENKDFHATYAVVRAVAPDAPVFGNIGAAEVARFNDADAVRRLADMIRADGFAVHLNPLQELLQPEGTPTFAGVLKGIELMARSLPIPIIVKEIGAGLSADVARRVLDAGASVVDVAGAGGTSWAGVEILRLPKGQRERVVDLWDWGIPSVDALRQVAALKDGGRTFTLVSSGGVESGFDIAKSFAFGADIAASARPLLKAFHSGGRKGMNGLLDRWTFQLKGTMFLTGSRTLKDLSTKRLRLRESS
jgi:isopentenyl-diphosphate delta-isomerase